VEKSKQNQSRSLVPFSRVHFIQFNNNKKCCCPLALWPYRVSVCACFSVFRRVSSN